MSLISWTKLKPPLPMMSPSIISENVEARAMSLANKMPLRKNDSVGRNVLNYDRDTKTHPKMPVPEGAISIHRPNSNGWLP